MKKLLATLLALLLPIAAHAAWTSPAATGAVVQAQNTNATPLSVAYPATGTGTILLRVHSNGVPTLTLSDAGFGAAIATGQPGQGIDWIYCKTATGSESGSMTISASNSNRLIAQMVRFPTGGSCTVDASAHTGSSASLLLGYAALTVPNDNALILITGGKAVNVTSYAAVGGFTEIGQGSGSTQVSMVWNYVIQTSKANITSGTWTITGDASGSRSSNTIALAPAAGGGAPSFTVSPASSSSTTSSITFSATPSASATLYGVAVLAGTSVPTCTQVKAGQNGAGAAAAASANKAVTGADTLALSGLSFPIYDAHFCLNNGGGDSTVASIFAAQRTARASNQIVCLASAISSTSPFVAQTSPTPAAGDCYEAPTTLPGGMALTIGPDGDTDYISGTEREILGSTRLYDYSAAGWGATATGDENFTVVFNNGSPRANNETPSISYIASSAVSSGDFCATFVDPEGDALVCTSSDTGTGTGADKRPAGTTVTAGVLAGTPTTGGQSGTFTVTATDTYGATGTMLVNWSTLTATVTVPDCVAATLGTCIDSLQALQLDAGTITFSYSVSVAAGSVISQGTASGASVAPFSTVNLVVSRGLTPALIRAQRGGLGLRIGIN